MDPKVFEIKLSEIGRWQRVDEDKIWRKPEEVDPAHRNPQIEMTEFFERTYPCDWCKKRNCTGRRTISRSIDPETHKPVWKLYCGTCRCYWNPDTGGLSFSPAPSRNPRGRPKKNP